MPERSDQEFVELLRASVSAHLQAVDRWEAAYNRYYRLPGYAHSVSSDLESERREFDVQRRALESLLPRTGQLCQKYGMANPFPGLLRSSLGQYAPQERTESAISRNERSAVVECLERLSDACRGGATIIPPDSYAPDGRVLSRPARGIKRAHAIVSVVCAFAAMGAVERWRSGQWPPFGIVLPRRGTRTRSRAADAAARSSASSRRRNADGSTRVSPMRTCAAWWTGCLPKTTPVASTSKGCSTPGRGRCRSRSGRWMTRARRRGCSQQQVLTRSRRRLSGGFAPSWMDWGSPMLPRRWHATSITRPKFRQQASSLLARIGCAECLEPVKKALADSNPEVRQFALLGLMGGLKAGQRDEKFLAGVFPALTPLLNAGRYEIEGPATVMPAVDAAKAAPILESPYYFVARNPRLHDILTALDHEEVKVPRKILLPLLAKLEPLSGKDSSES
jgi:hypothetical protein